MKCEYYQCDQEAQRICIIVNKTILDECDCEAFLEMSSISTLSLLLCIDHTRIKGGGIFATPLSESIKTQIKDQFLEESE